MRSSMGAQQQAQARSSMQAAAHEQ